MESPPQIILASASPRRRWLLETLIPTFTVIPADLDEDALTSADPFATAVTLAREKALAVARANPGAWVIGGDTVVAIPTDAGWEQLAKPTDSEDAVRMLTQLQGRTHTVVTGLALVRGTQIRSEPVLSHVTFRPVSDEEIRAYVATGDPLDKAGAYGLQGAAAAFVSAIQGSQNNVIGLPTERLREWFSEHGIA